MRAGRILHPELARAVATMGHQDIPLVTDAGFPTPRDANRIDLAFYEGLPDVLDVPRVLRSEVFVEEVHFAAEVQTHNPPLYRVLQEIFTGSGTEFRATTHEQREAIGWHTASMPWIPRSTTRSDPTTSTRAARCCAISATTPPT